MYSVGGSSRRFLKIILILLFVVIVVLIYVRFPDNEPSYIQHTDFILEAVSLMGPDPLGAGYVPVVTRSEEEFSSGTESWA